MSNKNKKKNKSSVPEKAENLELENIEAAEKGNTEAAEEESAETASDNDTSENNTTQTHTAAVEKKTKQRRSINTRSLKHGSISAAFTAIFIAAVVVVNVIAAVISDRFGAAADLTGGGLYTLDEVTKLYLAEELKSEVTVTVLNSEQVFEQNTATRQVSEILKKMEIANSNVKLEYLSLDQNPNYVSRFTGETLDTDYIVIESKKTGRHRIITPVDYFGLTTDELLSYYYYYGYVAQYLIEQEAVGAMMYVSDENPVRVAFTEGYGEADYSALKSLLEKNGYSVETVNLMAASDIDPGIDFVIVHAPLIDIGKEQLAKLDKFLDNNGEYGRNVIYFASISQPKTPNIDEFLGDWSISVGFYDVWQMDPNYLISSLTPYAHRLQINSSKYTTEIYGSPLYTLGANMRPIFLENDGRADTSILLKTYDRAFLYPLDDSEAEDFDINTARQGVFNEVAAASKTSADGALSRVIAVGSETFSQRDLMSYTNGNNGEFFVILFNYVSGKTTGIVIQPKTPINVRFEMTAKTANALAVVLCVVIPVCIIVIGITVWIRRRHR